MPSRAASRVITRLGRGAVVPGRPSRRRRGRPGSRREGRAPTAPTRTSPCAASDVAEQADSTRAGRRCRRRRRWRSRAAPAAAPRSRGRTRPCRGRAGRRRPACGACSCARVALPVDDVVVPAQDRLADQHGDEDQPTSRVGRPASAAATPSAVATACRGWAAWSISSGQSRSETRVAASRRAAGCARAPTGLATSVPAPAVRARPRRSRVASAAAVSPCRAVSTTPRAAGHARTRNPVPTGCPSTADLPPHESASVKPAMCL